MHKGKNIITLEELRKGKDDVLKQVYQDNRDKCINFIRKYNLSEEDLVDVYHDSYVIFYDNVMTGKIQKLTSSISTYLISICRHLAFNKLKKGNRMINPDSEQFFVKAIDQLIEELEIENNELTKEQYLLYKYFNTLGKKCKELLDMFYYRGFTISDILIEGIYPNENVIKSSKSRCLKTLKDRINNDNMD